MRKVKKRGGGEAAAFKNIDFKNIFLKSIFLKVQANFIRL